MEDINKWGEDKTLTFSEVIQTLNIPTQMDEAFWLCSIGTPNGFLTYLWAQENCTGL